MSSELKIIEERLSQLVTMVDHLRTEQQVFKERMEVGFEAVNLRLDKVEQRLDKVEQRLDKVEPLLVEIKEATNFLSHKTGEHDKDIFVLKRHLPSQSL